MSEVNLTIYPSGVSSITLNPPDQIPLTIQNVTIETAVAGLSEQEVIDLNDAKFWDKSQVDSYWMDGTSRGTDPHAWSTAAFDGGVITYATTMKMNSGITNNGRCDLRNADQDVSGGPTSWTIELWKTGGIDFNTTVKMNSNNSGTGKAIVGIYRIHQVLNQCIHGFVADPTTNTWHIQIVTNNTSYVDYDTGVSTSSYHNLRVVVAKGLSSISFYIDGTLINTYTSLSTTLENEYPAATGVWVGCHVRTRGTQTVAIEMEISDAEIIYFRPSDHIHGRLADIYQCQVLSATDGQVLTYNAASDTWINQDLTVDNLQGVGVQSGTPTDNDVLIYSASPAKWQHQSYATAGISAVGHTHAASDVTSGTFAIARIPTGTTSTTVSLGNHTHAASDVTSGTFDIARIPTGSTSTTVCIGNDSRLSNTRAPSDANYGDITVSGSGTVMRINGGIHQFARVGPLSGREYSAMINAPALSATGSPSASTWYCVPFVCPQDMTVTAMKMYLGTGVGSSAVYMAIYASNENTGYPTGSPLVSTGSGGVATTSTPTTASTTISLAMTENTQYWLWFGTTATVGTTFRAASNSAFPCLGTLLSGGNNYNVLTGSWTASSSNYPNYTTTPITTSNLGSISPLPVMVVSIA